MKRKQNNDVQYRYVIVVEKKICNNKDGSNTRVGAFQDVLHKLQQLGASERTVSSLFLFLVASLSSLYCTRIQYLGSKEASSSSSSSSLSSPTTIVMYVIVI